MEGVSATYFDGQTPKGFPARVDLVADALLIRYTPGSGPEQLVRWPIRRTHRATWASEGMTRLECSPFPFQFLEVPTDVYRQQLQTRHADMDTPPPFWQSWLSDRGFRTFVGAGALLVLLGWTVYAYVLPALAERVVTYLPEEQEAELGKQLYEHAIAGQYRVDSARTRRVRQYWQATGISTRLPITITVVHHDEANAFAVPGGQVVVFDGMLKRLTRHEQLAALLAHEAAHVEYRHSLRQLARSVGAYALLASVFGDVTGLAGVLIENAETLTALSYSRADETEADAFSLEALAARGINPQGVLWLFDAFPREEASLPTLLRSHPQTAERRQAARERLDAVKQQGANAELGEIWKGVRE